MSIPDKLVQAAAEALITQPVVVSWRITEHEKAEVFARLALTAAFAMLAECEEAQDVVASALVEAWDKQPYVGQIAMQDAETALIALARIATP